MTTEDYVSFETAKLLKEKGFECEKDSITAMYNEIGKFHPLSTAVDEYYYDYNDFDEYDYVAPTLQMAMKWLRKVHEIFIRPNISFLYPIKYYCDIFCYGDNLKTQQDVTTETFESPEEACEAAIKYCLENLI